MYIHRTIDFSIVTQKDSGNGQTRDKIYHPFFSQKKKPRREAGLGTMTKQNAASEKTPQELHADLIEKMESAREKWKDEEEDDTDRLLNEAIEMSIQQGKGWADGEKEEYMKTLLDDDYIPPIFAESQEELEKSGFAEAFSSLIYDEPPAQLMQQFKQKGNDAFANGKRNVAKNVQFFRDSINHYYEAIAWGLKAEPINEGDIAQADTPEELIFSRKELDDYISTLHGNAAMAHMQLKNWGHVRDDSKKVRTCNYLAHQ